MTDVFSLFPSVVPVCVCVAVPFCDIQGLGLRLRQTDGWAVVDEVAPECSDAQHVFPDDVILAVNSADTVYLGFDRVVALLKKPSSAKPYLLSSSVFGVLTLPEQSQVDIRRQQSREMRMNEVVCLQLGRPPPIPPAPPQSTLL